MRKKKLTYIVLSIKIFTFAFLLNLINIAKVQTKEFNLYITNPYQTVYAKNLDYKEKKVVISKRKNEVKRTNIIERDIRILERIVEAEATGQSIEAKMNVCSVILNRLESSLFPNTIKEVIFQKKQFAPIEDKRFYKVNITSTTVEAVKKVIENGSITTALYFFNTKDIKSKQIKEWISNDLTYLFTDDSGHSFYTEKKQKNKIEKELIVLMNYLPIPQLPF